MKKNTNDTPFFDLNTLMRPEGFIAAAETEDELGCVLRMHLCLECMLDEFIDKIVPEEDKLFHSKRPQFSGKLSLAVAYGLCMPIAKSIYIINQIRNSFAHRIGSSIPDAEIQKIADLVDQIKVFGHNPPPVRQMWIELCVVRPGEKLGFGKHGARIDFFILCSELLRKASGWLVFHYISRNPHLVRSYTDFRPEGKITKVQYSLPALRGIEKITSS